MQRIIKINVLDNNCGNIFAFNKQEGCKHIKHRLKNLN